MALYGIHGDRAAVRHPVARAAGVSVPSSVASRTATNPRARSLPKFPDEWTISPLKFLTKYSANGGFAIRRSRDNLAIAASFDLTAETSTVAAIASPPPLVPTNGASTIAVTVARLAGTRRAFTGWHVK